MSLIETDGPLESDSPSAGPFHLGVVELFEPHRAGQPRVGDLGPVERLQGEGGGPLRLWRDERLRQARRHG